MNNVSLRLYVLGVAGIATVLACLAIGIAIFRLKSINMEWQKRTDAFVEQLNSLGRGLEPGGIGVIHLPVSDADELIFLGLYCSREMLRDHFPDRSPSFIEVLYGMSWDDHFGASLIWLRNGHVISRNRTAIKVGLDFTVESWTLQGRREIRVAKEKESPNGFLSVYFLEQRHEAGSSGERNEKLLSGRKRAPR